MSAKLTALFNHTHSPGECQPLENVRILTGGAVYGRPGVQEYVCGVEHPTKQASEKIVRSDFFVARSIPLR